MRSSRIGDFGSQIVSPVVASLRPGRGDDLAGDALLEALALVRVDVEQARDLLLLVRADVEDLAARLRSSPLKMRMKTTLRPSSIAILNASAANGSLFFGARVSFSVVLRGSTPVTGGTSAGDGR